MPEKETTKENTATEPTHCESGRLKVARISPQFFPIVIVFPPDLPKKSCVLVWPCLRFTKVEVYSRPKAR